MKLKRNESEASNHSDIGFKIMVLRMLKELSENYKELIEKYISMRKDAETINKSQEEMKNTISEMKTTLEGILKSRSR